MTGRRAAGRLVAALLAALLLLGGFAGCGRKAKPEPKWGGRTDGRAIHYG